MAKKKATTYTLRVTFGMSHATVQRLQSKDLHSLSSVCVVTARLDWSLCTVAWLMTKVTLKV